MVEPPYSMWTTSEIEAVHKECCRRGEKLNSVKSLVKQLDFFDEDERDNIISALETAKEMGVFLDDLEESIANIRRLWEIKQMLENLTIGG